MESTTKRLHMEKSIVLRGIHLIIENIYIKDGQLILEAVMDKKDYDEIESYEYHNFNNVRNEMGFNGLMMMLNNESIEIVHSNKKNICERNVYFDLICNMSGGVSKIEEIKSIYFLGNDYKYVDLDTDYELRIGEAINKEIRINIDSRTSYITILQVHSMPLERLNIDELKDYKALAIEVAHDDNIKDMIFKSPKDNNSVAGAIGVIGGGNKELGDVRQRNKISIGLVKINMDTVKVNLDKVIIWEKDTDVKLL